MHQFRKRMDLCKPRDIEGGVITDVRSLNQPHNEVGVTPTTLKSMILGRSNVGKISSQRCYCSCVVQVYKSTQSKQFRSELRNAFNFQTTRIRKKQRRGVLSGSPCGRQPSTQSIRRTNKLASNRATRVSLNANTVY